MKRIPILSLALLGLSLVAGLTTTSKADIIIDYAWIQSQAPPASSVNGLVQTSGTLTYDQTTGTVSAYHFVSIGALNLADNLLIPTGPGISTVLGDGDLLLSTPPSIVLSGTGAGVDGVWYDYAGHASPNENQFEFGLAGGAFLYGDWVPTSSVPEPTTVVAGALLLLPFGASALRILGKRKAA